MFDPKQLFLCRENGPTCTYVYQGIRIDTAADQQRVFVGVDRALPPEMLDKLLLYFGINPYRELSVYRFSANSLYYVQLRASQAA